MFFSSWLWNRKPTTRRANCFRPRLEVLEDRTLPSTFTVLNLNDSGADSLRAAVAAANSNPGTDTIAFAELPQGTIGLTSGELAITDSLTIIGSGANELSVSGNKVSRVFETAAGTTVTISGLTIKDGLAGKVNNIARGGGILNYGTLTVSDCTVSGNSAGWDYGGGIYNYGTLTVSHCTVSGNSAGRLDFHQFGWGGGIFNDGTLTVTGSILSGNVVFSGGGGIFNVGTLTVSGSTLSGNSAHVGGGIHNGGKLTVTLGSTLSDNTATYGGGIDNFGTLTVSGSTLSGNTATYGGGINNSNNGTLTLTGGSTLSFNTATYDGGGIWNEGSLTVSQSNLSNNSAGSKGGGIYNAKLGSLKVSDSFVSNNYAPLGADLYNLSKRVKLFNSTIGVIDP